MVLAVFRVSIRLLRSVIRLRSSAAPPPQAIECKKKIALVFSLRSSAAPPPPGCTHISCLKNFNLDGGFSPTFLCRSGAVAWGASYLVVPAEF